jgi:tetratricopeptide (TPR) repeat protein
MSDMIQVKELVQRGIAAAKSGQKEEAEQLLLEAVELDEENEQAWLWLSGLVESAEEKRICLENVLAINPRNTYAEAGLQWLEENAPPEPVPAEAQEECPHCGAQIPPSGSTCPNCGQPLLIACPNCGAYVDVAQSVCPECAQALGDFHDRAAYYLTLARAYLERHRNDSAEEALAYAQQAAGDDAEVLGSIAAMYDELGRPEEAIAAYEQAIAQAPKNASLYANLGSVYRRRLQIQEAKAMYEKAEKLDGNDPVVLFELAQLSYQEQGPASGVLRMVQKVIRTQPSNAEAYLLLGDIYVAQERYKQARQQYGRACQLTTADSELGQQARRKLGEVGPSGGQPASAQWATAKEESTSELIKRPGCISIYAFLMGIVAALSLLGVLGIGALLFGNRSGLGGVLRLNSGFLSLTTEEFTIAAAVTLGLALILSVIGLAEAIGLWNMRNWARIVEILRQGLGFTAILLVGAAFLFSIRDTLAQDTIASYPMYVLLGLFIALLVQAYFLFWFVANRERFR